MKWCHIHLEVLICHFSIFIYSRVMHEILLWCTTWIKTNMAVLLVTDFQNAKWYENSIILNEDILFNFYGNCLQNPLIICAKNNRCTFSHGLKFWYTNWIKLNMAVLLLQILLILQILRDIDIIFYQMREISKLNWCCLLQIPINK